MDLNSLLGVFSFSTYLLLDGLHALAEVVVHVQVLESGTKDGCMISMWAWEMELSVGSLRDIRQFRDDEERIGCCR